MAEVFTNEEFKGYEFRCTSESVNTGWKHTCRVFKDDVEVVGAKSTVNWGNRTWEPYEYSTVYKGSCSLLADIINEVKEPEIDVDFLNNLANDCYIEDWGYFEDGTPVILMGSWEQVEGHKKYDEELHEWVVVKPSVFSKLCELNKKGLLKPSIKETLDNIGYVFTDTYRKCYKCGTVHNAYYGDLTWVPEVDMELCDDCINTVEIVEVLIDKAKEDYKQALKPTVDPSIIESLGYSMVPDRVFSFEKEYWGADYIAPYSVECFMEKFGGFVQIDTVAQFVAPFVLWVPTEKLNEAIEYLES